MRRNDQRNIRAFRHPARVGIWHHPDAVVVDDIHRPGSDLTTQPAQHFGGSAKTIKELSPRECLQPVEIALRTTVKIRRYREQRRHALLVHCPIQAGGRIGRAAGLVVYVRNDVDGSHISTIPAWPVDPVEFARIGIF